MISKAILKSQIPHGMFKKVAEKAGVSTPAVTKFFNNQIVLKTQNLEKIL